MKFFKRSLRTRIFFSMIFLVLGASILIAGVTIIQYKDEAVAYQKDKLKRKEASIRASINYEIKHTTYEVNTKNIPWPLSFTKIITSFSSVFTSTSIFGFSFSSEA